MMFDSLPRLSSLTEGEEKASAAGIVVLRMMGSGWHALFLKVEDHWDLPKGKIDKGEDPLEAAIRETWEESGITELNFKWGAVSTFVGGTTVIYVAESEQDPDIQRNPHTGVYEHIGWDWVELSRAAKKMEGYYLDQALAWAYTVVTEDEEA